jgi:translation initiation factor IF-3
MSRAQAFALTQEKGLDIIEIAPLANPPVARIMDYDKFRYQREKEEKEQRRAQKQKELKQVRITARAAQNDLQIRVKAAEKFLNDGHKVEINLALRGREKGKKDWALQKMQEFLSMITVPYVTTMAPRPGGRGFVAQIAKK